MIEGYYIVDAHCHPIADEVENCLVNAYSTPDKEKDFFAEMRSGHDQAADAVLREGRGADRIREAAGEHTRRNIH